MSVQPSGLYVYTGNDVTGKAVFRRLGLADPGTDPVPPVDPPPIDPPPIDPDPDPVPPGVNPVPVDAYWRTALADVGSAWITRQWQNQRSLDPTQAGGAPAGVHPSYGTLETISGTPNYANLVTRTENWGGVGGLGANTPVIVGKRFLATTLRPDPGQFGGKLGFKGCEFVGGGSGTAATVNNADTGSGGRLGFVDCTLTPSIKNGITFRDTMLVRTLIKGRQSGGEDFMRVDGRTIVIESVFTNQRRGTIIDPHGDVMQSTQSAGLRASRNWAVAGDKFEGGNDPYNAVFGLFADNGPITDVLIEYNALAGGNYTIHMSEKALSIDNVRIANNLFMGGFRYGHINRQGTNVVVTGNFDLAGNPVTT